MINTIFIIFLIIAVMLLIYLSIKLFLFQHRRIENLIVYDNDIYIKINSSTFFKIKRKMEEHLSLEKHDICDEYTATFGLMKFIHLYSINMSEDAVKKTIDRIISGVTVDYINNQLKQFCDKDISTETDVSKSIITMDNWYKYKDIINNYSDYDKFTVGFATFFMNRTNRSGIIKAGVIGGKNQNGSYKLDVRFNKSELANKIYNIGQLKNHIILYNIDAVDMMQNVEYNINKTEIEKITILR